MKTAKKSGFFAKLQKFYVLPVGFSARLNIRVVQPEWFIRFATRHTRHPIHQLEPLENTLFKTIALGIVALFIAVSSATGAEDKPFREVTGTWEFETPTNDWHYVTISSTSAENTYKWKNKAGKEWTCLTTVALTPGKETKYSLTFGKDSPYPGVEYFLVRNSDGKLTRLEEFKDGKTKSIMIKK